jgi:ABC-2 type transport system ATP-binding protein
MEDKSKMNMIEVEGLTKRFGDFTAVDHIIFTVGKGMVFGFLGPNGAGKSTAIRMLCTLLRPTEGNARVVGFDIVKEQGQVRRHIGLVAEKIILYDQLTAEENLTLFGRLNNLPEEQIKKATDKWLDRLHMEAWRKHRVGTFSTGMKQRINVARALLHHPDVLFLDEPTLGLDPQTTHAIHEFILELREEGITIVLTTHDMVEAETLCEQIAIIDQAKIVALDTTTNLKRLVSADNTTVIDVEIANLSEPMLSQLKNVESIASITRPDTYRVRIHARNSDNIAPILNALNAMGANVRAINTVLPTMEDVFLHVTGREMRDKAAASVPSVRGRGWRGVTRVR